MRAQQRFRNPGELGLQVPGLDTVLAACGGGGTFVRGKETDKLLDAARGFLLHHFHSGANPGLCVCRADSVPPVTCAPYW